MTMTTTLPPRSRQPAFRDFRHEDDGGASLWVNKTLLPPLALSLQNHQHPSLLDLSAACTEVFRGRVEKHRNDHCSIAPQPENESEGGAYLYFRSDVLESASRALMDTPNRAVAKIGYELRNVARQQETNTEIRWKGGRPYFICGVNTGAQAVTLTFSRSALVEIANDMSEDAPMRRLFLSLIEVLDPEAEEVDIELDETTAAVNEELVELQG